MHQYCKNIIVNRFIESDNDNNIYDQINCFTGQLGIVDCYINLNAGPKVMKWTMQLLNLTMNGVILLKYYDNDAIYDLCLYSHIEL